MKFAAHNSKFGIAVVGAGPAGVSLAIRLAKENFRVCLIERERFPRPKLCGEFISPECLRHFRDLNVLDEMLAAGGERIDETVFYSVGGKSVGVPSRWLDRNEAGALSLSRAEMDFRLMEKARAVGVTVLEEHSIINLKTCNNAVTGATMRTKDGGTKEISADLIIDATGRARILSKILSRSSFASANSESSHPKSKTQNRLVGFKAHLRNVNLTKNVCEIYFFPGGYGGLSRVEGDLANFCFLVRADAVKKHGSAAEQILEQLVFTNRRAQESLENAEIHQDWLAVSIEGFGRRNLNPARGVFAVGDAGAFIDPFTGSGMLMAFESAEILAAAIKENCQADTIAAKYVVEHARKFRKRLFICSAMRRAAFAPGLAEVLISALRVGSFPRKILARATRPSFSSGGTT